MAEAKQQVAVPATIQSKFNITLTEKGFQALADRASKLIFNEEPKNLEEIRKYLGDVRSVEIAIEETHKKGKQPSLTEGKQWDAAKTMFLETAAGIKTNVQTRYTSLCQEVARKEREQLIEAKRVKDIKDGIESNAVRFASIIAGANTSKELTAIESVINLEKTRESKYMEFLPEATDRFTQLNTILKEQKIKVNKLEELAAKEKAAEESGDDQALIDIAGQKEEIAQSIDESKILVQEKAVEQSLNSEPQTAQVVYGAPRPKRSTWKWEVKDIQTTQKKMPSFVKLVIDEAAVDAYLAAKKAEGFNGAEEFENFGIRFFLDKTY